MVAERAVATRWMRRPLIATSATMPWFYGEQEEREERKE